MRELLVISVVLAADLEPIRSADDNRSIADAIKLQWLELFEEKGKMIGR